MWNYLFKRNNGNGTSYRSLEVTLSRDFSLADEDPDCHGVEPPSVTAAKVSFDFDGDHASAGSSEHHWDGDGRIKKTKFANFSRGIMKQRSFNCNFNIASNSLDDEDNDYEKESQPQALRHEWHKLCRSWVIVPELSESKKAKGFVHWVEVWDLSFTLMIFFIAYYLPWVLVFFTWDELPQFHRMLETIMSLWFSADMVLQFFIAYSNPANDLSQGAWQKDPREIVMRYTGLNGGFGWFWLDLASVTPFWLRMMNGGKAFPGFGYFQMLCLLRVLKMFRMLNLPRLWRFMSRWQASFGFSYLVIDFMKFLFILTLTAHLFACTWVAIEGKVTQGLFSYSTSGHTWLSAIIESKGDPCNPSAAQDSKCVYWLSLYWAVMTLTSVGYGDVTPQNQVEYTVCAILMMISGLVWAYIVGSVVSLIHTMDTSVEFKQNMDELNEMMESRGLPRDLRVRMRRYMHECVVAKQQKMQETLLRSTISEGLQREVARNNQRDLLKNIYWAKDFPDEAKMELVKCFYPSFYGPDEAIMLRKAVLVIQKGIMGIRGRVLRRGDVIGLESILLETNSLVETSQPRTLSYCFVMMLMRDDLLEVARNFEEVDGQLRRAQIRAAVRRAFLTSAAQVKLHRKAAEEDGHLPHIQRTFTQNQATFSHAQPMHLTRSLTSHAAPVAISPTGGDSAATAPAPLASALTRGRFSRVGSSLEEATAPGAPAPPSWTDVLERIEQQNIEIKRNQESMLRQLHSLQSRSTAYPSHGY
ncbi:unnamed protein product [Durusdinium trenchii]|uniref:Ion transport domain-containing protein n=1 Tax=Durusdinium trenchii TaxID=1381693 RepID=A0ABP0PVI3_9DINO